MEPDASSQQAQDLLPVPPPPTPPPPPIEIEKDFITTLESLPGLWDKTHSNYFNKYKRNDALDKLRNIIVKIKPRATIEDVKKKINVLRSNYRRELKKIISLQRSGAGTDELYRPKNWTFEYLKFLDKFEQPVPVNEVSDSGDNAAVQNPPHTDEERTASISSMVPVPPPYPLNKKKNVIRKQNELMERACRYLADPVSSQVSGGQSIAFEWAETLLRLTPTQRLYAKKAINDILFEAELGNLDRHSVQINVNTSSTAQSPYMHTQTSSSSSLYSHTASPNYMYTQDIALPAKSPNYSDCDPLTQSCNYTHCDPPGQSHNYTHCDPPEQSPNYTHCDPPAKLSNYTHSDPPAQSPNYTKPTSTALSSNNTQPTPTAPSSNNTQLTSTALSSNNTQPTPTAPSSNNTQLTPTASSSNNTQPTPTAPSSNYMQPTHTAQLSNYTQITPSALQEYILRIPSPSSLSQDSEYTAGSLFALFKP